MARESSGERSSWDVAASGSGMVFAVVALVAFLVALGPDDTSGVGIARYFAQHDGAVEWQAFLFGVSGIFLIWFAGTLASLLRRSESAEGARLGGIAFAGAAASTVIYFIGLSCWTTMAHMFGGYDGPRFSAPAMGDALTLYNLGNVVLSMASFTAAVFVGAASLALLSARLRVADWLAWAGGAVALVLLVNALVQLVKNDSGDTLGIVAFVLFLAWVFAASGLLAREASRAETVVTGVPAAR